MDGLKFLVDWLSLEFLIAPVIFLAGSWSLYKLFLKGVSAERHHNLRHNYYANIVQHLVLFLGLSGTFWLLKEAGFLSGIQYLAVAVYISGWVLTVKISRVALLQYLFLTSMRSGVPILIVNIFSLVFSLGIVIWTTSFLFQIQLAPLLATSAAFSIILGLALQDTLGNLFAGVALQLDRSFEIGDWLEIVSGGQKIVGQVHEITWRATSLIGFTDELITLPNRFISGAQISNYTRDQIPIVRAVAFYLSPDLEVENVKSVLSGALSSIGEIQKWRKPMIVITETSAHWACYKVIYFLDDYGAQVFLNDRIYSLCIAALQKAGIAVAGERVQIISRSALEISP